MLFEWNPLMDWNPVVHILDQLSDGTHSALELSYMQSKYEGASFLHALFFLADRGLIKLSAGRGPFQPIATADWQMRLQSAFSGGAVDPDIMTNTALDLSEAGERVLHLFKIGHP
ncbi:MAG: hypothetical protein PSY12_08780 [bacterium]|nr:hypothetical protein [bacterium]